MWRPATWSQGIQLGCYGHDVDTSHMTSISPELILVDPALRDWALAALPAPSDCLATPSGPGDRPRETKRDAGTLGESAALDRSSPPTGTPAIQAVVPVAHESRRAATVLLVAGLACTFLFAYIFGSALLDVLEASRFLLPI